MTHVTLQQLSAYLDGELPPYSIESVRHHLSQCADCTRRFGRMEAQEEILVRLLNDDPGDAFFESFLSAVASGEPLAATRPRRKVVPPPGAEFEGDPERLISNLDPPAAKPMPVPVPVPVPVESPTLHGRREEDREVPAPRRGAAGWIAAAILIMAALSLAVVTTRPRRVAPLPIPTTDGHAPAPVPAPAPMHAIAPAMDTLPSPPLPVAAAIDSLPAPWDDARDPSAAVAPPATAAVTAPIPDRMKPIYPPPAPRPRSRTIETPALDMAKEPPPSSSPPAPAPAPAEGANDAAADADWRLEIQRATERSLGAARTMSAASFDEAADAWEGVIPRLGGAPEEEARARRELAQARFQAWAAEASTARRNAAIHATRAYLLYAPPGPDRDQAWTWLGRLKR